MNKLLLIVDPQIDFIHGTLPVPEAAKAMDKLTRYITEQKETYLCKVITTDWHPFSHCSFETNGGQWPIHCVQFSTGASLYPPLEKALYSTAGKVEILSKGTNEKNEEYSIFKNQESSIRFREILEAYPIERIDICGIAGDICVLNTLRDGIAIYGASIFNVLTDFSPSLDGGIALNEFIKNQL